MKFLDEYRDAGVVKGLVATIASCTTRPWTIMEICGGQTHSIVKYGLDEMLPSSIRLVHGPGCPVCVTPAELIDQAVELSLHHHVILASFGDMLRVPGTGIDLLTAKARGADVRTVYSPLDAVAIAKANPTRDVVFFAVGFETTAPANAMSVIQAEREGLSNFFLLASHVLVPPAMEAILGSPDNQVQGFLAAGHVCAIMGTSEYGPIADRYHTPIVVTGFEPVDILEGILRCIRQLEAGQAKLENAYTRAVKPEGNVSAQALVNRVFEVTDRNWRGLGQIPRSGLSIRPEYKSFDAQVKFKIGEPLPEPVGECISGLIMRGIQRPPQCPAFGTRCTPDHPIGAPMVSTEGACAAYFNGLF